MLGECLDEKQVYRMDRSFFIICEIARAGILKSCGNAKKQDNAENVFKAAQKKPLPQNRKIKKTKLLHLAQLSKGGECIQHHVSIFLAVFDLLGKVLCRLGDRRARVRSFRFAKRGDGSRRKKRKPDRGSHVPLECVGKRIPIDKIAKDL